MIIVEISLNVWHCKPQVEWIKVFSYIKCCRRVARDGNGGAKLPLFSFLLPLTSGIIGDDCSCLIYCLRADSRGANEYCICNSRGYIVDESFGI